MKADALTIAETVSGLLEYSDRDRRGKLERKAAELLAWQQNRIEGLQRELAAVARIGGSALTQLHETFVRNPAPDAAAPSVPSGICGTAFVTR
jgi:hypothetical protein